MAHHVWDRLVGGGDLGESEFVVDHVGQRKTMHRSFEYVASQPMTTHYWLEKGEPCSTGFSTSNIYSYGPLRRVLVFSLIRKIQAS